jgi:hypothetical protein
MSLGQAGLEHILLDNDAFVLADSAIQAGRLLPDDLFSVLIEKLRLEERK